MGPITILDKSAYQCFSHDEHIAFSRHFMQNLTSILVVEILADLSKESKNSTPDDVVQKLAKKFGGSGPSINADYDKMARGDLQGNGPQLTPQIKVDYGRAVRAPDGALGLIIDLHPINESILGWARGQFTDEERGVAAVWRLTSSHLDPYYYVRICEEKRILLPRVHKIEDAIAAVDNLLNKPGMQLEWLYFIAEHMEMRSDEFEYVLYRWYNAPWKFLRLFAPYAYHCLRVMVLVAIATKNKLIPLLPTNHLDTIYLFYLPHCHVFCSQDRVHRRLAPLLLRSDQSFVTGDELKPHLARAYNSSRLVDPDSSGEKQGGGPIHESGLIEKLWKRHMKLPRHGEDLRDTISPEKKQEIIERFRAAVSGEESEHTSGGSLVQARRVVMPRSEADARFGLDGGNDSTPA